MSVITEISHLNMAENLDLFKSSGPHQMESSSELFFPLNARRNISNLKCSECKKTKDTETLRHVLPIRNRSNCQRTYLKPHIAKRKAALPASVRVCNSSTEAVLCEQKVEIKDLESQVVYLQKQIKELRIENKTLVDLQARQKKEIRKFEEGVADIPSLLKSHKDEIKAVETSASALRRELLDCRKDLKAKSDAILRKDQHLDKLNLNLKGTEKCLQELSSLNKELKLDKKKLEEESKILLCGNEELKSKSGRLQKRIQQMTNLILNLEERIGTAEQCKAQLEDDLRKLQKEYDQSLQNEITLKKSLEISTLTISTQTDTKETVSTSCMTMETFSVNEIINEDKKSSNKELEERTSSNNVKKSKETENCHCSPIRHHSTANESLSFNSSPRGGFGDTKHDPGIRKEHLPLNSTFSLPMKTFKEHDFVCINDPKFITSNIASPQTKHSINNKCNNLFTVKTSQPENRILKRNPFLEDGYEGNFSFNSNNSRDSVPNTSQKHKRLFSNFTLKQCYNSPDDVNR